MKDQIKEVVIVGAGISGLALAYDLSKTGQFSVSVFEKRSKNEILQSAYPFALHHSAIAGLGDQLPDLARKILERREIVNQYVLLRNDKLVFKFNGNSNSNRLSLLHKRLGLAPETGTWWAFPRELMIEEYLAALPASVSCYFNHDFTSFSDDQDNAAVFLDTSSGPEQNSRIEKKFDLLIGADGVYSQVRGKLFPKDKHPIKSVPLVMKVKLNVECRYLHEALVVENDSSRKLSVVNVRWGDLCTQMTIKSTTIDPKERETTQKDSYHFTTRSCWKKWTKGNVILIGDATHAISPVLGIGGSMALGDARALSRTLVSSQPLNHFILKRRVVITCVQLVEKLILVLALGVTSKSKNLYWWVSLGTSLLGRIRHLNRSYQVSPNEVSRVQKSNPTEPH